VSRWQDRAACKGATSVMFPARGDYEGLLRALRFCDSCPVRSECLDYALEIGEKDGIYGGTTGRQRRDMRKNRPRPTAQHGTRSKFLAGCRCDDCAAAERDYKRALRGAHHLVGRPPAIAR